MTPGPPPVPGGRSGDERERARLEREARRSGRPSTPAGRREARSEGTRRPPPRAPRQPTASNRRAGRLVLAIAALLGIAVAWFLIALFQPFSGDGGERTRVTIKPDSSVGEIGSTLSSEGIVSSGFFFELRATLSGKRGDLKPGTYTLREEMSYADAIAALEAGPPQDTIQVGIPEGRSRSEIAASLAESGLRGDYERATRRFDGFDPSRYGAERPRNLEGFLWPATYELKRGQSVNELVRRQLDEFERNFDSVSMRSARSKNLTPYDVLIIASLVERETAVPRERRLIAGVIYNRLSQGQRLDIDATVRFLHDKWDGALTQSDLNSDSPYNTRKFKGLPPGPIGNPGLASIRAAANPAQSDYLFYVSNPCKPGTHTFHATLADFEAAAARYHAAREAAGGRAPQGC